MAKEETTQNGHASRVAEAPDSAAAPVPISLRERQRREREEAIVHAALSLMGEVGYEAMTMDDLAERAGISKPTLYQHFPSKEAIAVKAVMLRVESCFGFIEHIDPELPAFERLERIVRWVLENKFLRRKDYWPALQAAPMAVVKAHPEYQARYRRIIERTGAIIDEAKRDGAVDQRKNTRVLAQMIFSLVRDHDYQAMLEAKECSPEALIDTLVATYLGGLAAGTESREAAKTATAAAA